jgi:hypothetical protein
MEGHVSEEKEVCFIVLTDRVHYVQAASLHSRSQKVWLFYNEYLKASLVPKKNVLQKKKKLLS